MVKGWAERNPLKLRQIRMNYNIANAKVVVELTEEEKKAEKGSIRGRRRLRRKKTRKKCLKR